MYTSVCYFNVAVLSVSNIVRGESIVDSSHGKRIKKQTMVSVDVQTVWVGEEKYVLS